MGVSGRGWIWAVFGILMVKIAIFVVLVKWNSEAFFWPDSNSYISRAVELVEHGRFLHNGKPDIFRTPGYPLFLVPFIRYFGVEKVYLVILPQFAMLILTAYFVRKIALMTYEDKVGGAERAGKCALVVTLVDPALVISEFSVLTEILYTLLIVTGVYSVFEFMRNKKWYYVTAAGVFFALSAYVRPIGVYLGYLVFSVLLLSCVRTRNAREALIVLLVLVMQYSAIEVWKQRNRAIYGERIISTSASAELYHYIAAAVVACADGKRYEEVQKEFEKDVVSENQAIQAKHNIKRGLAILLKHPFWTAYIGAKGLLVNMFDPGTGILANKFGLRESGSGLIYKFHDMGLGGGVKYLLENERYLVLFTALGGLWIAALWGFMICGVIAKNGLGVREWLLLVTVAYYIVLAAGPGSHAKYRVPSIPAINVFVAGGMVAAYDRLILRLGNRGRTRKPA